MSSFGQRMLLNMGWTSGKGLGKNDTGRIELVEIPFQRSTAGIGSLENQFHPWWEDAYVVASQKLEYPCKQKKKKKYKKNGE